MTDITRDIVRELLHYDPETGIFTWRERGMRWFKTRNSRAIWNNRFAGQRAGRVITRKKYGYQCRLVKLLGGERGEHRVVWLWMTDDPIPEAIDHINRDATDNRWANLRASSAAKNQKNASMKRSNTSGVTGVCWNKRYLKWCAQCRVSRKRYHIGYFNDLDDAAKAVASFRAKHGFDPEHGMDLAHYIS